MHHSPWLNRNSVIIISVTDFINRRTSNTEMVGVFFLIQLFNLFFMDCFLSLFVLPQKVTIPIAIGRQEILILSTHNTTAGPEKFLAAHQCFIILLFRKRKITLCRCLCLHKHIFSLWLCVRYFSIYQKKAPSGRNNSSHG